MKKAKTAKGAPKKRLSTRDQMPASKNAAQLRRKIEDLVRQEAVPMVESAISEAKDGHFAVMKYLLEMAGVFPGEVETRSKEDDSLAKILLQRLGMTNVSSEASIIAKEISATDDTVK